MFLSDEQINKVNDGAQIMSRVCRLVGRDLLHNHKYRSFIQLKHICPVLGISSEEIDLQFGCGTDIKIPKLRVKNGEMKTRKIKAKKITKRNIAGPEFDKQNDPYRRQQTLKYDALFYSLFDEWGTEHLLSICVLNDSMKHVNDLLLSEQEKFLKKMDTYEQQGKRLPRDSIVLPIYKLLQIVNNNEICIIANDRQCSIRDLMNQL